MRIKRKRGACIGLSFLLAVGSISFPGYAQEQGSPEVSTEAPAEEATEQAHVGPEDAGEMPGTMGPGEPSQIPQMILLMGLWIKRTGRWEKKPLIPDRTSSMMRSPQAKIPGARTQPDRQRMKSRERQQLLWKGPSVQFSRTWPAASLHLKPERLS